MLKLGNIPVKGSTRRSGKSSLLSAWGDEVSSDTNSSLRPRASVIDSLLHNFGTSKKPKPPSRERWQNYLTKRLSTKLE